MRVSLRGALAAVTVLVASAAVAVPAAAQAPPPTISLSLKTEDVSFGDRARITARLAGHPGGDAGRQLVLLAAPWPFAAESVAQTLTTGSTGTAVFRPAPRVNTRYRVVLAQAPVVVSRSRTVFAAPVASIHSTNRPGKRFLVEISARAPRERSIAGLRHHFYDRLSGERRWVRRATRRFRRTADERFVAAYSFRARSGRYHVRTCSIPPPGLGRPNKYIRGCGNRTLSLRAVRNADR